MSDPALDLAYGSQTESATESTDPLDIAYGKSQNYSYRAPKSDFEVHDGLGGFINGLAESAGNTVLNIPHGVAHAAVDLYRRATRGDTSAQDPKVVQSLNVLNSANAQDVTGALGTAAGAYVPNSVAAGARKVAALPAVKAVTPYVEDALALAPLATYAKGLRGAAADFTNRPLPKAGAAQAVADAARASQSMGAATVAKDVTELTPETQAELAAIGTRGSKVNAEALDRVHDAETLRVPVRLTEGEALGDDAIKSKEYNNRQKSAEIGERYAATDNALRDTLSIEHREAAPTAVGNDEIANGREILDSLKRYDAPIKKAIDDQYQTARDLNGGNLQMDGSGFVSAANQALQAQGRYRALSKVAKGILKDVDAAGGKMSLDDFEGYRTQLADEAASAKRAGKGNRLAAINKVRDALEATQPVGDTAAQAKAAFDKARSMYKARAAEMEADPAYEAAVEDSKTTPIGRLSREADKFTQTYVANGAKADLQQLRRKLDQPGQEAMTSSSMNRLRAASGADKDKFLQNGYHTALNQMSPRADELFGSDLHDRLQQIDRVGSYTQGKTREWSGNPSGTLVGALAQGAAGEVGRYLEDAANTAVPFLRLGDRAAGALGDRARRAAVNKTLKPGAGLEQAN